MPSPIDELIEHLQTLNRCELAEMSEREVVGRLDSLFRRALDTMRLGGDWRVRHASSERLEMRLDRIERSLHELHEARGRCPGQDTLNQFPNFLTALTDLKAQTSGHARFEKHFADWFSDKRAVIVDPYIFSRGEQALADYCARIVNMIGAVPTSIDFYFGLKGYQKDVADRIFADLNSTNVRDFHFYRCANIHDRVWMKHFDLAAQPAKAHWKARVVGASVNGINDRPTYIVDMDADDAGGYSTYLQHVRNDSTTTVTTTPPP